MNDVKIKALLTAILFITFATADAASNRIYKTVDEDGNTVFTDIPPREDESGEQIVIENPNTFQKEEALGPSDQWIVEPEALDTEQPQFRYQSLSIAVPGDDETIRNNAGNVSVVTLNSPRLQRGHRMQLFMDGQLAQEGVTVQFYLENVDRGTHSLHLEIVDDNDEVLIRSAKSTFHLQRHHI